MTKYLSLAITSIKAAKDIVTAIQGLRDFDKIRAATLDVKERLVETTDHILSSNEQLLTLQKRIADTEEENERLKDWVEEKKRYTRKQIATGVFAYVANDFEGPLENAHKYCCNCLDKTIPSTLQQGTVRREKGIGHMRILTCPNGCPNLEFRNYIDQN